jgi:pyruvate/2-oxoglutarate dehydrogenase complex dihydrolipoamide acyltransferase (E2) component
MSCLIANVCNRKMRREMINNKIEEIAYMNLNFTIDHRFLDGSLGGKIAGEVIIS